jgi:hypothetical protein
MNPKTETSEAASNAHPCVKIRKGLYNYRAYNIRHFPKGWAVRDENGKPWHSPIDTLAGVCRMIDRIEYNTRAAIDAAMEGEK